MVHAASFGEAQPVELGLNELIQVRELVEETFALGC